MPKKQRFELHDVPERETAPVALEFQVAKAATEWERACRLIDGTHTQREIDRHARAHLKLRRVTSLLIDK